MQNDKYIVNLFWERDESAITALSNKYGLDFIRISNNILNSKEDAKECVNDSYLRTWNSIPKARPDSLFAYTGKIVRNLSIDRLKQQSAQKRGGGESVMILSELQDCLSSKESVESTIDGKELSKAISEFLWSIRKKERVPFLERYWFALEVKQIADRHNITAKAVESLLYRCRKKLKTYLKERGYDI